MYIYLFYTYNMYTHIYIFVFLINLFKSNILREIDFK